MRFKHDALTQNLAPAYSTTGNALVDFFAQAGASRANPQVAVDLFDRAYNQDPLSAVRLSFYFRTPRGGQGERSVFRAILRQIAERNQHVARHLIKYVPEYGRWDDLIALRGTHAWPAARLYWITAIANGDGLANKWAPREKSANREIALDLIDSLGWTSRQYRQHIARHTQVVEQQMCNRDWDNINFSHVPSQALMKYRQAFYRHQEERFSQWVDDVRSVESTEKANVSTLLPHQFIRALGMLESWYYSYDVRVDRNELEFLDTMWNELLKLYSDVEHDIMPVIDVSGSMMHGTQNVKPIEVSTGLGLFLSEMIQGRWKRKFITFSAKPNIIEVQDGDISEKLAQILDSSWGYNTDLAAVMNLLADTASLWGVQPPETIMVISDMQFDPSTSGSTSNQGSYGTGFEHAVSRFTAKKLRIPRFVWWNVNNSHGLNFQFTVNSLYGVETAYVSGFSPVTIKNIIETGELSPTAVIDNILEKFSDITIPQELLEFDKQYKQLEIPF